ncbi:MAG: response regulator transcription factor [Erysipelotrichaceae bacterium]|nr:response regulator transcription factor [Erysipelotrichaceae bacterium]
MSKVLIVEDERIAQEMLATYVQDAESRYELVGVIADAANAEVICLRSEVDLILMDVCTENDESGIEATKVVKRVSPNTKVIIVTSAPEVTFIDKAKEAGADSFYYKNITKEKLIEVMDRTMEGERIWPKERPIVKVGNAFSNEFTPTELKVLRYLADGYSVVQTASALGVEDSTVRTHVKNLKEKMGVNSITAIVRMVTKTQLILPEY